MSVDNRTELNDCDTNTGWTGDGPSPAVNTTTGQRYQGTGSIDSQHTNSDEEMDTTNETVGPGTFSLDFTDTTLYIMVKDNLHDTFANGGTQYVLGDGTDKVGFVIAGNDAVGMPLSPFYNTYKLDASNLPSGSNATYSGVEGNLTLTAITTVGIGTLHLAKAVGNVNNIFVDYLSYIANDSYALTINGGTSGTPETMADVQGDDETNGWGMVANPLGSQYTFFAPTEWGESAANADHYFTADGEQWFWLGDNAGGHAMGATHFPFRVIGNVTDIGSFVISNVSIVNTGTGAEFDCSDTDIDTLEIDGCSMAGLATFSAPSSGGTSRFCINTIFSNCGVVTHNGADMSGGSVLVSNVAADIGALLYNESSDPDTVMDGMTFSMGSASHHAIDFGTAVTSNITLRDCNFTGFGSGDDANDSTVRFLATSGSLTLSLVGCTVDGVAATEGNFSVDDAAGITVTLSIDPVTTLINVKDNNGANLQNVNVYLRATDGTGDLPFEESVTIARASTTATVTHTAHGLNSNEYVKIEGITDKTEDNNGAHQITVTGDNAYTYTTTDSGSTSYTGTIISTGVTVYGLTDASGNISTSRTYGANQPLTGFARKSTTSPRFKTFEINESVSSSSGLTVNIRLILDE